MNDDKPSIPLTPGSFSVSISAEADVEGMRSLMRRDIAEWLERFKDEAGG